MARFNTFRFNKNRFNLDYTIETIIHDFSDFNEFEFNEPNFVVGTEVFGLAKLSNSANLISSGISSVPVFTGSVILSKDKSLNTKPLSFQPIYIGYSRLNVSKEIIVRATPSVSVYTGGAKLVKSVILDVKGLIPTIYEGGSDLQKGIILTSGGLITPPAFSGYARLSKKVDLHVDRRQMLFSGQAALQVHPVIYVRGVNLTEGFIYQGVLYLTTEVNGELYITDEIKVDRYITDEVLLAGKINA